MPETAKKQHSPIGGVSHRVVSTRSIDWFERFGPIEVFDWAAANRAIRAGKTVVVEGVGDAWYMEWRRRAQKSIGRMNCEIWYDRKEHELLIIPKDDKLIANGSQI